MAAQMVALHSLKRLLEWLQNDAKWFATRWLQVVETCTLRAAFSRCFDCREFYRTRERIVSLAAFLKNTVILHELLA